MMKMGDIDSFGGPMGARGAIRWSSLGCLTLSERAELLLFDIGWVYLR